MAGEGGESHAKVVTAAGPGRGVGGWWKGTKEIMPQDLEHIGRKTTQIIGVINYN